MSKDEYMLPHGTHEYVIEESESQSEQGHSHSPLRKIHQMLRGRYHWAILLGLVGLVVGAVIGFLIPEPLYQSQGSIQIVPAVPRLVYQSEKSEVLPMYEGYINTQMRFIQDQRTIDMAMASDKWQEATAGKPYTAKDFRDGLNVSHPVPTQLILVSFMDENPAVAKAAVESLIEAYEKIYGENDVKDVVKTLESLRSRRSILQNEINVQQQRVIRAAGALGPEGVERQYMFSLARLNEIKSALDDAQNKLLMAEDAMNRNSQGGGTIDAEAIAEVDPQMREYLSQKRELNQYIQQMSHRFGSNHRDIRSAKDRLASLDVAIARYLNDYQSRRPGDVMAAASGSAPEKGMSVETLKKQIAYLQEMQTIANQDTDELGEQRRMVAELKNDLQMQQDRLMDVEQRINQLETESKTNGRINVNSYGTRPMLYKDRRPEMAAIFGAGGGSIGLGLILLIGLIDRRFRSFDDARISMGRVKMLGVLPSLPEDLAEPEHAELAAHCVHHIRTLLQIDAEERQSKVLAITSPTAGSGKTSLSLALGLSYAASDTRTLLIDCDLVGRGLTSRMETIVRRKIGQILLRQNLVTPDQLDEAVDYATHHNTRLGQALVHLGHLTQEQLDHALTIQENTQVGLLDAVAGEPLDACIDQTGIPGLFVLPLGMARANHMPKLSPSALRRVLDEARERFDTVIVDTGPIPGSVEASTVAAQVDGVILTVSRGDHRPVTEKALTYLQNIDAHVAGVVFNRAQSWEVVRSGYASSSSRAFEGESASLAMLEEAVADRTSSRFGPIPSALIYSGRNNSRAEVNS